MLCGIANPIHNPKVHNGALSASNGGPQSQPSGTPAGVARLLARAHGQPDDAQLQTHRQLPVGTIDFHPTLQLPR